MDALVLGIALRAGHDRFYADLLASHGLVVAADGAAEECVRLGRVPDAAVGDFDSAIEGAAERLEAIGVQVKVVPADKDESDLDIAVSAARSLGASSVTITGAFADRLDHTLAAFGTLVRFADLAARALEPDLAAWGLEASSRRRVALSGAPGRVVSLMSPTGATGVTTSGLVYSLNDADLAPLSSLGLSNQSSRERMSIEVGSGSLVVLAPGLRGPGAVREA